MTGGAVVETLILEDKKRVWIKVTDYDQPQTAAIYVTDTVVARCIESGDSIYWSDTHAFWTPNRDSISNGPRDVKLKRVNGGRVKHNTAEPAIDC